MKNVVVLTVAIALTMSLNPVAQAKHVDLIDSSTASFVALPSTGKTVEPIRQRLTGLFGDNGYSDCLGDFIGGTSNGEVLEGRVRERTYKQIIAGFYGSFLCIGRI